MTLELEKLDFTENLKLVKSSNIIYLDYTKLNFPLIIRRWEQGDWFIPFGMKGKKKISDYFTDNKFSLIDKENTWLLCSGDDIVWIVGHRADDRYRIDNETNEVLRVTLH